MSGLALDDRNWHSSLWSVTLAGSQGGTCLVDSCHPDLGGIFTAEITGHSVSERIYREDHLSACMLHTRRHGQGRDGGDHPSGSIFRSGHKISQRTTTDLRAIRIVSGPASVSAAA